MAALEGSKTSFFSSISPWTGSRSTTPKSSRPPDDQGAQNPLNIPRQQRGGDHTITKRHKLSLRKYPKDVPPLRVRWFYAVDIPKRKPFSKPPESGKPSPRPKKWVSFSPLDSYNIEAAFQKLSEREEAEETGDIGVRAEKRSTKKKTKVAVNEDYLFDVEIEEREVSPAYWSGPVYDVCRGTWFFQEGSSLRPCDENLATQLEEGYLKIKPWRITSILAQQSSENLRKRSSSGPDLASSSSQHGHKTITHKSSVDQLDHLTLNGQSDEPQKKTEPTEASPVPQTTYRLFGTYMNSIVTYQDSSTAWLTSDDFMSRMSTTVYQRFGGVGGTKVIRGFIEQTRAKEGKETKEAKTSDESKKPDKTSQQSSDESRMNTGDLAAEAGEKERGKGKTQTQTLQEYRSENLRLSLERQMSSLNDATNEEREEEARKRDEKEMEHDYREQYGADQGREIDHLILVTHGIGQQLSIRMEGLNFVHDVNVLRKTIKSVYSSSADLQALNSNEKDAKTNCRIFLLPVCWRHLLDFPKQTLRQHRKELDLADADFDAEVDEYPDLQDITVEGIPAIRNLLSDLGLDILLYQSAYRERIAEIVSQEMTRIYRLFKERNPSFNGKVSLIGHSLGSAIIFDILCRQKSVRSTHTQQYWFRSNPQPEANMLDLEFDTEAFFALGSPIGLFQMLKGRKIVGRSHPDAKSATSPFETDSFDDPFLASAPSKRPGPTASKSLSQIAIATSSPKCGDLYNIFHPSDPVAHRIEPLISRKMASLKPQPLPYTKKGLFGAQGQGITSIGARVGQSVGSLWTNLTSGVASSILNRSLGISGDDSSLDSGSKPVQVVQKPATSAGATADFTGTTSDGRKRQTTTNTTRPTGDQDRIVFPINTENETLYSGFQRRRTSQNHSEDDISDQNRWEKAEEQARSLRREEEKVRALNSNGRVDYSIQEGVFDISLIASIASHLSYWSDEDVSHFIMSQLLSRPKPPRQ